MAVRKFKKKPVRIEAIQLTMDTAAELTNWCGGLLTGESDSQTITLMLPTLQGVVNVRLEEWVIRDPDTGQFSKTGPDDFNSTYDEVSN